MAWNSVSLYLRAVAVFFCNGNWGAAKEVTGSCTLIETRRSKCSLDCGQRTGAGYRKLTRVSIQSEGNRFRQSEECKSQPGWGLHRLWLAFEIRGKGAYMAILYDGWVTTMIRVDLDFFHGNPNSTTTLNNNRDRSCRSMRRESLAP